MPSNLHQKSIEFPARLADKYRPRSLSDFTGLARVKRVMAAYLRNPCPDVWLFLGPSGRGKSTMAMAIAEVLGAEFHHSPSRKCDLEEIARVTSICRYAPFNFTDSKSTGFHVWLIDEGDMLLAPSQAALLSKMDATDMPPKTIIILTANSTAGFEPRLLSRFKTLPFNDEGMDKELPKFLAKVARKEGLKGRVDFGSLAIATNYNVRDCLAKLELELLGAGYLEDYNKK